MAAEKNDGTVGKALEVLDRVASFGRPVRFSELLEGSPFPKASLYRFLQTLTNQGMLSLDRDRQTYAPGIRLVRLAHAAWQQSSLAPIARPHIEMLSKDLAETVHLAQLDHGHVLYVDKRNAVEPIEMYSQAGKVGPAYCTGVGKAMLAFETPDTLDQVLPQQSFHRFTDKTVTDEATLRAELQDIRERGYAVDDEEHEVGIICVAVPILSDTRRVLGGLSVTTSTGRRSLKDLKREVPRAISAAAAISDEVQTWRFPDQNTNHETARVD